MTDLQVMKKKHKDRIGACKSCGQPVIWFGTKTGGRMPVDASTVCASDTKLNLKYHRSHFATCPDADKHRKRRKWGDGKTPKRSG